MIDLGKNILIVDNMYTTQVQRDGKRLKNCRKDICG